MGGVVTRKNDWAAVLAREVFMGGVVTRKNDWAAVLAREVFMGGVVTRKNRVVARQCLAGSAGTRARP